MNTIRRQNYAISQQHTPIVYFHKGFPDIEYNNYLAIKTQLAEYLPCYRQNFWYIHHPDDLIVGGNADYLHKQSEDRSPIDINANNGVLNDLLVTRIWFDKLQSTNTSKASNPIDLCKQVQVLMERGNFFYRVLLAISQPHRFSTSV